MDTAGPSGTESVIVSFGEEIIFSDGFELLDSGVSCNRSKNEHRGTSSRSTVKAETPGPSVSWGGIKADHDAVRPKLFKTRAGVQRNATFKPNNCINLAEQRALFDETRKAVSSVNEANNESNEINSDFMLQQGGETDSHSTEPSSSNRKGPLEKLTLMIGKKILRFKVVNAPRPQTVNDDRRVTVPGVFRCAYCKLTFTHREDWSAHMQSSHGSKQFICVVCGMGFNTKASLSVHHRTHTNYKPYQCVICHKAFSRASNHNLHMKMHQTGQRHFCQICGRCFKKMELLVEHQMTCVAMMNGEFIQTDRPLRYQCSYCEKLFHHKRDKYIHERIHTGEKPYQCGYCGRGFTQSQGLTIHIRLHTGERPYTCLVCGKQYRDNSALRKHEYKHNVPASDIQNIYENGELSEGILDEDYSQSIWHERA